MLVIFCKVRNLIITEKLNCKIPQVEELRFPDSSLLLCVTVITSSPEFLDKAAHGMCTHTCLCWLQGD